MTLMNKLFQCPLRYALLLVFVLTGLGCDTTPTPTVGVPEVGTTWRFDFDGGEWVEPSNAESVLEYFPTDYTALLGVQAVSAGTMDLTLAIATTAGAQDFCNRTVLMPGVRVNADRTFQFGPEDFTIANGITTENLILKGVLSEDLKTISEVSFSGDIVMATVPDDLLEVPEGVSLCEILAELRVPCVACRDGALDCLRVQKIGIAADAATGVVVQPMARSDCHVECALSAENPDCDLP